MVSVILNDMNHLDQLENKSIYIIREAYAQFKNIAILWSIGKDSTTMLHLCRKAFFGKLPFPAIHIDTGAKFQEMYDFRDKYAKEWELNLIVAKNEEAMARGIKCGTSDSFTCCNELKTNALKQCMDKNKLAALLLGIRRDEHGIRAKERVFSPRNKAFQWNYKDQPPELWDQFKSKSDEEQHIRVHPLLHWTEVDIWEYVKREKLPINELYFAKNGKRFRSLGCKPNTTPIESTATNVDEIITELKNTKLAERAGRSQDKESSYVMQRLRALGYM
jgi:sulfate adenylyltransferase subunit 2